MMKEYVLICIYLFVFYTPCESRMKRVQLQFSEPSSDDSDHGNNTKPPFEWFNQKLDHFDPNNAVMWKQRYQTNATFFKNGTASPVFILVSGEEDITGDWITKPSYIRYAEIYGALCFQLEHRFYGKSHPTPDISTKNLRYLSVEQALADTAYFIEGMNQKYGLTEANKWIAFGGSYAGNLVAWLRLKYPNLVHGAVSSSGPVLAKKDFRGYYEVVTASVLTYGQNCLDAISNSTREIQGLLKNPDGQKTVRKLFRLCGGKNTTIDVKNKYDIENFYQCLADNVGEIVQYNKDNCLPEPLSITIDVMCDYLTNETNGSLLERYGNLSYAFVEGKCLDYKYSSMVHDYKKVKWDKDSNDRAWTYQYCTELGYLQTSSKNDPFGLFDLKFNAVFCEDIFGKNFTPHLIDEGVSKTNTMYGGLDIQVTQVVFVHGSIDPWHVLGITESNNEQAPAIFINGTAHCADMYPETPEDLPQLKEARLKIIELIGQWLKQN